jgi:GMP synthase-like glutamine amidotransferase
MPRCLVVQHHDAEGPYRLADVLEESAIAIERCRVYANDAVPRDLSNYEALVVMGGSMSATTDDGFATRRAEIDLLHDAVLRRLPVLGICLGAQLLAAALGAEVYRGSNGPEIGWMPVEFGKECADDPLFEGVRGELTVFHWHGDTFDVPEGAVALASSQNYANQAFRFGVAWGLQFHLEADEAAIGRFAQDFEAEARSNGVTKAMLTDPTGACLDALGPPRDLVLRRFAALVTERAD